jgi:cathepsin D
MMNAGRLVTLFKIVAALQSLNLTSDVSHDSRPRVKLTRQEGVSFIGDLSVGTPGQSFRVLFDTGVSDFWVFSSKTPENNKHTYRRYFDDSQSRTWVRLNNDWSLHDDAFLVSGFLGRDVIEIAGITTSRKPVIAQVTALVEIRGHQKIPIDGVLGLGLKSGTGRAANIVKILKREKVIPKEIVVFESHDLSDEDESFLFFGSPVLKSNEKLYLNHVVRGSQLWSIRVEDISIGDQAFGCGSSGDIAKQCHALLDSGTEYLGVCASIFEDFVHKLISQREDCYISDSTSVSCTIQNNFLLPNIVLHINQVSFELTPSQYMRGKKILVAKIPERRQESFILGELMIRSFKTVLDYEDQKIGFIKENPCIVQNSSIIPSGDIANALITYLVFPPCDSQRYGLKVECRMKEKKISLCSFVDHATEDQLSVSLSTRCNFRYRKAFVTSSDSCIKVFIDGLTSSSSEAFVCQGQLQCLVAAKPVNQPQWTEVVLLTVAASMILGILYFTFLRCFDLPIEPRFSLLASAPSSTRNLNSDPGEKFFRSDT